MTATATQTPRDRFAACAYCCRLLGRALQNELRAICLTAQALLCDDSQRVGDGRGQAACRRRAAPIAVRAVTANATAPDAAIGWRTTRLQHSSDRHAVAWSPRQRHNRGTTAARQPRDKPCSAAGTSRSKRHSGSYRSAGTIVADPTAVGHAAAGDLQASCAHGDHGRRGCTAIGSARRSGSRC